MLFAVQWIFTQIYSNLIHFSSNFMFIHMRIYVKSSWIMSSTLRKFIVQKVDKEFGSKGQFFTVFIS